MASLRNIIIGALFGLVFAQCDVDKGKNFISCQEGYDSRVVSCEKLNNYAQRKNCKGNAYLYRGRCYNLNKN